MLLLLTVAGVVNGVTGSGAVDTRPAGAWSGTTRLEACATGSDKYPTYKGDGDTGRSDKYPTYKDNPWSPMVQDLMNEIIKYTVPLILGLLFGWIGKKLGFDLPDQVKKALEAFIFKVLAQIKADHAGKSNKEMQEIAAAVIKTTLPNKLMKVLTRTYGSVEGAIEYYYPRWVGMKKGAVNG
jgi:hypothetical protein